jgi:hypothetical protein
VGKTDKPEAQAKQCDELRLRFRLVWNVVWLATFTLMAAVQAQETPRRLPPPDVPVEELKAPAEGPKLTAPKVDAPQTNFRAPAESEAYTGPPASIDGPSRLPPAIEILPEGTIAPGIGPEELVPFADSPIGPILPGGEYGDLEYYGQPQKLSPYKDTFFQKLSLSAGWFGDGGDPEDLGATEIETFLTVALPAPIVEWPLLITPGFNVAYLQGPRVTDLPPRLFFTYVDIAWVPEFIHRYKLYLSVAPSVLSDFESSGNGAFRVTGKALLLFDWVPERAQLIAGVLYLNRENVQLLPAGGIIWKPTDWTNFELLFPKPKLGVRLNVGVGYEDWVYTTAEFGGNTWSVVRASGDQDKLTYLDYRILVGVERKLNGGAGFRLEAGYVFGREVEFESGDGDFHPKDTILIRGGIAF